MEQTVNIENINGTECTVIRKPFDAEWVKGQLEVLNAVNFIHADDAFSYDYYENAVAINGLSDWSFYDNDKFLSDMNHDICVDAYDTFTILPPLPRNPTPEDAPLLHRYMAEGLELVFKENTSYSWIVLVDDYFMQLCEGDYSFLYRSPTITHGILNNGERVEIAIKEQEDE